jgi:hypothetical protein
VCAVVVRKVGGFSHLRCAASRGLCTSHHPHHACACRRLCAGDRAYCTCSRRQLSTTITPVTRLTEPTATTGGRCVQHRRAIATPLSVAGSMPPEPSSSRRRTRACVAASTTCCADAHPHDVLTSRRAAGRRACSSASVGTGSQAGPQGRHVSWRVATHYPPRRTHTVDRRPRSRQRIAAPRRSPTDRRARSISRSPTVADGPSGVPLVVPATRYSEAGRSAHSDRGRNLHSNGSERPTTSQRSSRFLPAGPIDRDKLWTQTVRPTDPAVVSGGE